MARKFLDEFRDKWYEEPTEQRDKRTHHTMTDQFGRQWQTTIDMTAKPKPSPCGPIAPDGWHDPLATPDTYKRFDPANMFRLTIDVDSWIKEWSEANNAWEGQLTVQARKMSPADEGAALLGAGGADLSPVLLDKVGARPQPVEYVLALKGGNKWAAGLSPIMPQWAKDKWHRMLINTGWFVANKDVLADVDTLRQMFPDAEDELTPAQQRMAKVRGAKGAKQSAPEVDDEVEPVLTT